MLDLYSIERIRVSVMDNILCPVILIISTDAVLINFGL